MRKIRRNWRWRWIGCGLSCRVDLGFTADFMHHGLLGFAQIFLFWAIHHKFTRINTDFNIIRNEKKSVLIRVIRGESKSVLIRVIRGL